MCFEESGSNFLDFFKKSSLKKPSTNEIKVGIAVMPWMQTCVPWFSLLLALMYYKEGYDVKIIFHDNEFLKSEKGDCKTIERVLKKLFIFDTYKISAAPKMKLDSCEKQTLRKKARENIIYFSETKRRKANLIKNIEKKLYESSQRLKNILTRFSFDHLVVPGGIYGPSSSYFTIETTARVATYDSGFSTLLASPHGIAAQLNDTYEAVRHGEKIIDQNIKLIRYLATKEIKKRSLLSINRMPNEKMRPDVVIPLNIFDDSAAINQVKNFKDPYQWLSETLKFLTKMRCITFVREHPIATKIFTNREIFFKCQSEFKNSKYIKFISAEQPDSIYEFFKQCKLVLPVSSTAGIEAACLGKPIILESRAYYRKASFAEVVKSRTEYFNMIRRIVKCPQILAEPKKQEALIWYFMQKISCGKTRITPDPADFDQWSKLKPYEVFRDPVLLSVFESISKDIPFAFCRLKSLLFNNRGLKKIICYIKLKYCSAF